MNNPGNRGVKGFMPIRLNRPATSSHIPYAFKQMRSKLAESIEVIKVNAEGEEIPRGRLIQANAPESKARS